MEEDRAATNLGPDIEYDEPHEVVSESKQPRKRFIGRRAAEERAAARGADKDGQADTGAAAGAVAAPKPTRAPRTLNQIPADILNDEGINAALAHLPRNYNFEIHKTIHRIRTSGATNIALQFPEGLLMFAPLISDILTQFCPGTDTLIMGDVTYGACCIDDYTARALGCDLLVHYGHSCLVPVDTTKGIKTLYVFVTIGIDVEHLIATIERNFQSGKRIALVGTIQFNSTLHAIVPRLRSLGYDPILPRSAPLSAGEILGCTAPSLTASSLVSSKLASTTTPTTTTTTSSSHPATDADLILYVGDGRFHLESILIASPTLRSHTYRYDPYARRLTHETYEHTEMHSLRRSAIRAARLTTTPTRNNSNTNTNTPRTWALILGTLGRQGNPHTLELIKAHLTRLQVPWITLLLSEVTPQKLALMSADVGVWVQIACPRLSIDWGYAFERPLLSPYEACVALDIKEGSGWSAVGEEREEDEVVADGMRQEGEEKLKLKVKMQEVVEDEVGLYPMDFYAKEGLGRTRADEVPMFEEIEVV